MERKWGNKKWGENEKKKFSMYFPDYFLYLQLFSENSISLDSFLDGAHLTKELGSGYCFGVEKCSR